MSTSSNKTQPTDAPVEAFLASLNNPDQRQDAERLIALMAEISGHPAGMWGSSIIGFGHYHYIYASGREGDLGALGFAPRKDSLTIYLADGVERHAKQLAGLGPHKTGVGCVYIKRLDDINQAVLKAILADSYRVVMTEIHNIKQTR